MKYSIFSSTAPAMPKPSKGTEFCKLFLSQASKDMQDPPVSGLFPVLCAKNGVAKFLYSDFKWKVFCGQKGYIKHELPRMTRKGIARRPEGESQLS